MISNMAASAALAERTLSGDLRDYLLGLFREQRNPWPLLSETQQSNLAAEIEVESEIIIKRCVEIIGARNFPAIGVNLEQVTFKPKGVEAKMTFGAMDMATRHELVDRQGGRVIVVAADPDVFRGSRGLARIDKQQPDLPLDQPEATPYTLGKAAALEGGEQQCPYEAPSPEHEQWLEGYRSGAGERAATGAPADEGTLGYNLGYEDGKSGRSIEFCPFPGESAERARYHAGYFQAQLDGLEDGDPKTALTERAALYFSVMGIAAAVAGQQPIDNPFAEWMPARKAWNDGFFADTERARDMGAKAGKAGADESTNPFGDGTPEHEQWLAGWIAPEPGAGHPSEEPLKRGRGRPRKESRADQPGA
ncbi:MAG TPA: hypothetical protein VHW66_19120 [Stellaceae bacterium]|nr:hypothetical protein [Stellaceae bacterium]